MARSGGNQTKAASPRAQRQKTGPIERALRGLFGWLFRILWWVGLRVALLALVVLGTATAYYYARLPDYASLLDGREGGSVTLLDDSDSVFAWRGEQLGLIDAADVSPYLRDAVIAIEDRRFYQHFGIDFRGTARALYVNMQAGATVQGGSSITQQVAKLIYFDNTRTLERKLKELPAALALELKFTKDEILSMYLNRAYLGAGATGFEAAAQRYFGKSAAAATPAESAMLAGLLRAPSRFAPTNNLERAQARAGIVVDVMESQGMLTPAQAAEARANPARLSPAATDRAGSDFADWVMSSGPNFLTRSTTEDIAVLTTFDPRVQRAADQALQHVFETKVRAGSNAQAAVVVMSPDGAVRALIGGREIGGAAGEFNRATQARRQTGSLFKTFVYAAAMQAGASPYDLVQDAPLTINIPGSGAWSPQNYTRDFRGQIDLAQAFAISSNTAAVRVSEGTGRARVRAVAADLGIASPIAEGPAVALGVSEATLLEMTGAFAGFLNGGFRAQPYGMRELRLRDDGSRLMTGGGRPGERVLDERAAGYMVWMMSQVLEQGTGARAQLPDRPSAGKTGTTQSARDAWFIGFTADYVTGVWMGYDDNTPLTGVTGGGLPADVWRETMLRIHEGLPPRPLPMRTPPPPLSQVATHQEPAVIDPVRPGGSENTVRSIFQDVMRSLLGN